MKGIAMFLDLRRVAQGDKGQLMKHGPAFVHWEEFMIRETSAVGRLRRESNTCCALILITTFILISPV